MHARSLRDGLRSVQLAFREASVIPDPIGRAPARSGPVPSTERRGRQGRRTSLTVSESTSTAIRSSAAHRAARRCRIASSRLWSSPSTRCRRTTARAAQAPCRVAVGDGQIEHAEFAADRLLEPGEDLRRPVRGVPRLSLPDRPHGGAAQTNSVADAGSMTISSVSSAAADRAVRTRPPARGARWDPTRRGR
jgi:hypothetical protein